MKITGTENSARMSFTASIPLEIVGELDVGEDQSRRVLAGLRHGLVASDGDAGDVMAEVADDRLDIHRDDRLVLDDEDVGERLALDLAQRLGDQRIHVLRSGADQIGRIVGREAFERGQKQAPGATAA